MTSLTKVFSISVALALFILSLLYWPEFQSEQDSKFDLAEAEELLRQNRPQEAAELIKAHPAADDKKWLELLVEASQSDPEQLLHLFHHDPKLLQGHEAGALLVANTLLANGDWKSYQTLRALFPTHDWFIQDADSLILSGDAERASELLKSRFLNGPADTERLLRLALLQSNEHPKYAWDYLEQAVKKDPNNPDLHLHRAQLLESTGKKNLALAEYVRGSKEELAHFYLREGDYKKALTTLLKSDSDNGTLYFLSQVIEPVPYPLAPQEHSWLQILQQLKEGHEGDALVLLNQSPLDTELTEALKSVILYRTTGEMPKKIDFIIKKGHGSLASLLDVLKGPYGYATLFLARGWNEAAIKLSPLTPLPETAPDWIAPALTEALRHNRGLKEALAFAKIQPQTPQLKLILATLSNDATLLSTLAHEPNDSGKKAAWELALQAFEKNDYAEAKSLLALQPDLAQSTPGIELLARIALNTDQPDEAAALYAQIESTSLEAKSFLAKKAFADKDLRKAYTLTEELLKADPSNPTLKQNLAKIVAELER